MTANHDKLQGIVSKAVPTTIRFTIKDYIDNNSTRSTHDKFHEWKHRH